MPTITCHYSAEEMERLFELVQRKDDIDTYWNKETGELTYHARVTEIAGQHC